MTPLEELEREAAGLNLEDRVANGVDHYLRGIEGHRTFNWDFVETHDYEELFPEREHTIDYDGRALVVAQEDDVVVLRDPAWDRDFVNYLNSVDLGPRPENIIALGEKPYSSNQILLEEPKLIRALEILSEHNAAGRNRLYHTYNQTPEGAEVARRFGASFVGPEQDIASHFRNKALFREFARDLGIQVAEGKVVDRDHGYQGFLQEVRETVDKYGAAFIRGTEGSGGLSAYKVEEENLEEKTSEIWNEDINDIFLVEKAYDVEANPSVLFRISPDGNVQKLSPVAGQVMDGPSNMGNFYHSGLDPLDEVYIRDRSNMIAQAKAAMGFRGEFGIDWMITEEGPLPAEDNPRVTGQTPLAFLNGELKERHGAIPYIGLISMDAEEANFASYSEELQRADGSSLLYDGSAPSGVIPTYFTSSPQREKLGQVIFHTDRQGFEDLTSEVVRRINPGAAEYVFNSIPWVTK